MICLTMCVFFLNVDIPQLKEFASDPQVQDSLRHMKAAFNNSSQSGKIITF